MSTTPSPPPAWQPPPPPSSGSPLGQPGQQPPVPAHPQRRVLLLGIRALVWLVYAYLIVTEVVLTLGFLLLLFGANPDASFVAWAYRSLDRAMEPFRGMFTPIDLGLSGSSDVAPVLDTSVLFAMLVYAFGAWAVHALLDWIGKLLAQASAPVRAPTTPPGTEPTRTFR
jgi:uncharacterized protein YggT (Ycf19 family)